MASDVAQIIQAAQRYGPSVDHIAARYTNPVTGKRLTGEALILKTLQGESSALTDPGKARHDVSSAGARGFAQFMPTSRAVALHKFGVDPWKGPADAVHAMALHLRGKINGSTGLEGYNPGGGQGYVDYILGQHVGAHSAGSGGSSPAPVRSGPVTKVTGAGFDPGAVATASAATSSDTPLRAAIQSAGVAPPVFTPGPPLPKEYRAVQAGAVVQPAQQVQQDVAQPIALPADPKVTVTPGASAPASSGGGGGTVRSGKVVVAAGAERAGHGLQAPVKSFLGELAGRSGRTVTVTTGTNHNQFVSGRPGVQSDHWDGNAADLGMGGDARSSPAVSRKGDLVAAHAIQVAAGVSYAKALSIARGGGIHNFNTKVDGKAVRVQIIWKAADHYDHVHVGVAPR